MISCVGSPPHTLDALLGEEGAVRRLRLLPGVVEMEVLLLAIVGAESLIQLGTIGSLLLRSESTAARVRGSSLGATSGMLCGTHVPGWCIDEENQ